MMILHSVAFACTLAFSPVVQPKTVALLDYHATVPAAWTSRTPASPMRLAEFVVGAPGGAEVVVYFFGVPQGGTVNANLERWKSQFTNPTGGAVEEKITRDKSGAIPLTIAEYRGTYARGVGVGSTPDQALPITSCWPSWRKPQRARCSFSCLDRWQR